MSSPQLSGGKGAGAIYIFFPAAALPTARTLRSLENLGEATFKFGLRRENLESFQGFLSLVLWRLPSLWRLSAPLLRWAGVWE